MHPVESMTQTCYEHIRFGSKHISSPDSNSTWSEKKELPCLCLGPLTSSNPLYVF